MQFHYIASKADKGTVEGNIEAEGISQVLENLSSRGLRPISVKIVNQGGLKNINLFGGGINTGDEIFLTKYLSLMLRVGTNLFEAIDILIEDFEKPALKSFLVEVKGALEKGQPFYSTFARYPKFFSPVFVNLIKAGEASGNLDKTLEELSVILEKEEALRHKIKSAVIYPIVLVCMAFLVVVFLLSFVLPKIAGSFITGTVEPPLFSRIVFAIGFFFSDHIILIFSFIFISLGGLFVFFRRTVLGKNIFWRIVMKIPIIGGVISKISIQRFATTFSSLLHAGVPIIDCLDITANVVGNEELAKALRRVAHEGISKGLTVGDAFKKEATFPRAVVNLMAISEKAGHLDSILITLSNFYEGEIVSTISTLISLLEPVLLVFIGTVIGGIALSILVPIYQLASTL